MAPPPDDLRAALSPGTATSADTFTLDVTSPADAEGVVLTVVEVDKGLEDEPKGPDSLVGKFFGKIVDHTFKLIPRKKGDNPELNPKPGANAPKVKFKIGGTVHTLPLPGAGAENGIFELQILMTAPGHKDFRSDAIVYVRDFQFFKAQGKPRPVVTFLTDDDNFLRAAGGFWRLHADAVINRPGIGLEGILTFLRKFQSKFGNWGEVNIVNHGNLIPMFVRLFDSETEKFLDGHKIDEAFDPKSGKNVSTLQAAGLDSDSRVVFRACNAGNNPKLLAAIHQKLLKSACPVFIPKRLQGYMTGPGTADEFFAETVAFFHKSKNSPSANEIDTNLKADFLTKNPGGDWDKEKSTFNATEIPQHPDTPQNLSRFVKVKENDLFKDLATATKKPDADLTPFLEKDWTDQKVEENDRFWLTKPTDWEVTVDEKKQIGDVLDSYWFESTAAGKATSTPKILLKSSTGTVTIGSGTSNDIQIPGADSEQVKVEVNSFNASTGFDLKVTNLGDHDIQIVFGNGKGFKAPKDASATATGFVKVQMKGGSVLIRFPKEMSLKFGLHRHFIQRRRKFRKFDAAKEYKDRDLVKPDLANTDHYGKAG